MDRRAPVFHTLGCRLNAYETEAMRELSAAAGVEDAVIVNTCAVTAEAVRKARQEIRKLRRDEPRREADRHRLRRADGARDLPRHGRGRPRHRQHREDAPETWTNLAADFIGQTERCRSTTSCR
jgi:threonylcarbamoyladenosine tRNA methylthiotransferase MtaB